VKGKRRSMRPGVGIGWDELVHSEIYRRNGYGDGLRCMMQEGRNGLGDRQGVLGCVPRLTTDLGCLTPQSLLESADDDEKIQRLL
jgi:hypothetical protein